MGLRSIDIFLVLPFLITACYNDGAVWQNDIVLPDSILESADKLSGEFIIGPSDNEKFIYAKDYFAINDSVVLVVNNNKAKHFLEFININSKVVFDSLVMKGNGPLEMLNCNVNIREGTIYVQDFVKNNYCKINIDDYLLSTDKTSISLHCYSKGQPSSFLTGFSSDSLLVLDPYCFQESKNLNIHNSNNRFVLLREGEYLNDIIKPDKYDAYNVSQGTVVSSQEKNRIIFFSLYSSLIEVYDYHGNRLYRICGPHQIEPDYRINERSISFHGKIPYAYMDAVADSQGIYVTFIGKFYYPGKMKLESLDSYIIRFDWDGNPMKVFHLPFFSKTITKVDDHLYVRSISEGVPTMIQIDIQDESSE